MTPWRGAAAVRWGAWAVGILLFVGTLYYIDIPAAADTIVKLGVALPLVLILSGLWHLARTWAWAWCFPDSTGIGFLHLARVRLAAEAFSYLTLRGIAGEPLKVVLLDDRVDPRDAAAAVALERIAYIVGTTVIVGVGSVAALVLLPLTPVWLKVFRAFALGAGVIIALIAIVLNGRGTYVGALLAAFDRRFATTAAAGRIGKFIAAVERQMLALVRAGRTRLVVLLVATAASYALMALEAWVILRASGASISAAEALTVETFSRVASFASAFIPANLGALEASSLAAAAAVGLPAGGTALALARRVRGLFWAGLGLALYPRGSQRGGVRARDDGPEADATEGPVLLYVMRDRSIDVSPHVRLAGLPLSERILCCAFRAGYRQVIAWTDETDPRDRRQSAFIRTAARFGKSVVLVRSHAEWNEALQSLNPASAVTAIGPGTLVSPELLADASAHPPPAAGISDVPAGEGWPISGVIRLRAAEAMDLRIVTAALRSRSRRGERPSGEDASHGRARLAIQMRDAADIAHAEYALRRSSYKDTDAKIARFNRRMSLPISIVLMRTPLTANQLSVVLVALGFYAGWLFSVGQYWPSVLAAFLSLAASVLDGCDGEIARLKYQESALGCWIETVGDYSYYIAIFIGLTVGAAKQTGLDAFHWIGACAMAGTLVTFALLIYLRARITNGQPNRLHAVARDRFQSEPSLWSRLIWRVAVVATRAGMPYGIMLMALLNLLPIALVLIAIGANVYWISLALKLRDLLRDQETVVA